MGTVSIRVCDEDRKTISTAYARNMQTALADAIGDAHYLLSEQRPRLYLRDCLGGLRAEVIRQADGTAITKRTS